MVGVQFPDQSLSWALPISGGGWQALMASGEEGVPMKAGTSSCGVLRGILNNPADLLQYKVRWAAPPLSAVASRCA